MSYRIVDCMLRGKKMDRNDYVNSKSWNKHFLASMSVYLSDTTLVVALNDNKTKTCNSIFSNRQTAHGEVL